jgi:hypothetical protein
MDEKSENKSMYNPSEKEKKVIQRIYDRFRIMIDERNRPRELFNDRTLIQFIDDSQKRVNSYVPSRESQGKEEWQSNTFYPATRNKLKAILAAVALDIPPVDISAQNEDGDLDFRRAETIKHLVNYSYSQGNPRMDTFFEAWENCEKGTVIVYEGHEKILRNYKTITSVDLETGEVEWEEEKRVVKDCLVNFIVPLEEVYIERFDIFDIRQQPDIIWAKYYSESEFDDEFGSYKNAKFVKAGSYEFSQDEEKTFFAENWKSRVSKNGDGYEVIRYYNVVKDEYIIIINGVLMLDVPMLWTMKGEKVYPFAKTVFEILATNFFYGNSLANSLMGENDVINSLYNMALDKTYRSMVPYQIIGMVNKDDFDLEDEEISTDTKIYVTDIDQHKFEQVPGINAGEIKMLEIVGRGLDLSSVDANQQGVADRGVTAREIVIANENAKKLKGVLYLFLQHLAVQKVSLRIMNILTYYTQPKVKKILGEDGKENTLDQYRKFIVENAELSDGSRGILGIQMVGGKEELPTPQDLEAQEMQYRVQGMNYEAMAITKDYLNEWQYDVKISIDDFFNKDANYRQAAMIDFIKTFAAFFPTIYQVNQATLFRDFVKAYEKDPDKYQTMLPMAAPATQGVEPALNNVQ